ncbi:MAG: hypothetical protein ACRD2C_07145 [Acidimicrobiales bacterium]
MKKFACKVAGVGLIAGLGLLFVGASPASASDGPITGPQSAQSSASGDGVLAGNSGAAAVAVPVRVCGNAGGVGIFGGGGAVGLCELDVFSSDDDWGPATGPQSAQSSAEGDGVGTGNSGAVTWATPVDVCGNAVGGGGAGIGIAGAACDVALFSH